MSQLRKGPGTVRQVLRDHVAWHLAGLRDRNAVKRDEKAKGKGEDKGGKTQG